MELDEASSSGYSSCCSSSILGPKKWQYNNKFHQQNDFMQTSNTTCLTMPHCSTIASAADHASALKYYGLKYRRKTDVDFTLERLHRQQLLDGRRRRNRQLNFDYARSLVGDTAEEYASSNEETCCGDEEEAFHIEEDAEFVIQFDDTTENSIMMEELIGLSADSEFLRNEKVVEEAEKDQECLKELPPRSQLIDAEDDPYRILDSQLYSPLESLVDATDLESELSESEVSFLDSDSDTEREEDGYATSELFEADESDSESDGEENQIGKLASILTNGTEVVRHRFPYISIRLFLSDLMCLMDDSFINDTIVDFCLNNLIFNVIPEDAYRIHALPSTFWYYMQMNLFEDASYKTDALTEKLTRRYSRLAPFIEHVDLFDNDFVVLPINDDQNNWSLCVICCPNKLLDASQNQASLGEDGFANAQESNVIEPRPCILMFDSQPANGARLLKYGSQMREFVQFAYMYQNGYSEDLAERFSDARFPIVMPTKLPQQQSDQFNSGIYILEYARHFFMNPPSMRKVSEADFEFLVEYPTFTISNKRSHLKQEILSMSKDRRHFEELLGYRSD